MTQPEGTMHPVPGFPGYYVNGIGAVFSTKRGGLHQLKVHATKSGALFVHIYRSNGTRRCVRIRKLLRVHGIVLEDWMKKQLYPRGHDE